MQRPLTSDRFGIEYGNNLFLLEGGFTIFLGMGLLGVEVLFGVMVCLAFERGFIC